MTPLTYILGTSTILAAFVVLTHYEAASGARICSRSRSRLDRYVDRVLFIFRHVDFGAFVRDEVHRALARAGHDVAHVTLRIVRASERLLTRLVRHLRMHHEVEVPRETSREYVKTLSDFKGDLKASRSETSHTTPE